MYLYTTLFLLGLFFVRLSSVVLTSVDPFSLIAKYTARRNLTSGDVEELPFSYFHIMCSFYTAIFAVCYLGLTSPSTHPVKTIQRFIDSTFTFLIVFGLQLSFLYAQYTVSMVAFGCFVGSLWSIFMVNIARCIKSKAGKEEFKLIAEPCFSCCMKREMEVAEAQILRRADIYVY